jgi:hypothetical protein
MHALQFLGGQLDNVTIVGRGQYYRYGENFLRSRCRQLIYLSTHIDGLSGLENGRFRETGLGFIDYEQLFLGLKKLLLPRRTSPAPSLKLYRREQESSAIRWLTNYALLNHRHLRLSVKFIEDELIKIGFPRDAEVFKILMSVADKIKLIESGN